MTSVPTEVMVQSTKTGVNNMANIQNSSLSSNAGKSSISSKNVISNMETEAVSNAINGREARNLAEKHRRDKLNASIAELAKMVPHVSDSSRRLDKTTILRYAAHGLRLQYIFGISAGRRRILHKGENHMMTNTLLHLLDSFFITLTCHGQIVIISSTVEHLLGHCQSDLVGQNLLQLTHPEDQEILRQELIPSDIQSLFFNYPTSPKSSPTDNTNDQNCHNVENNENYLAELDEKLRTDKRCFTVRLARASSRSESKRVYEIVQINGCFRRSDFSALAAGSCGYPLVSQLIRRSRNNSSGSICGSSSNAESEVFMPHLMQHDAIAQAALHGISGNDIILVAMARIIRASKVMSYSLEANRLEYKTRHLIDGRIVDCDNRIGLVAGYLREEVCNLSPFSFMHQDDVRWVIVALRQMYDSNSDYGESCYRLLSRNGSFIYLNTKGYLEIDKGTNKVHSFVCVNTLLDEEEGKRKVQEMKNKFSIIINAKVPTNTMQDIPASQNPQQLEKIVLYLIENLQSPQTNTCIVDEICAEQDVKHNSKTSPLSLVAPEPASVKNSISKSVSVVISTAAKSLTLKSNLRTNGEASDNFRKRNELTNNTSTQATVPQNEATTDRPTVLHMRTKSGCQEAKLPSSILNSPDKINNKAQHVSVLKRILVDTSTKGLNGDAALTSQPAKRTLINSSTSSSSFSTCFTTNSSLLSSAAEKSNDTANFHDFISSSLRHVGESLDCIDVETSKLRHSCSSLPTCLDNELDAIIIEQQEQNKFFVNIKNEYDIYRESSVKLTQNRQIPKRNQHTKRMSVDKF